MSTQHLAVVTPVTVGEAVRLKTIEVADLLRQYPAGSPALLEDARRLADEQTRRVSAAVFAGVVDNLPVPRWGETARPYGARLLAEVRR